MWSFFIRWPKCQIRMETLITISLSKELPNFDPLKDCIVKILILNVFCSLSFPHNDFSAQLRNQTDFVSGDQKRKTKGKPTLY